VSFEHYLEIVKQHTELVLPTKLPILQDEPQRLHEAMHYAVMGGGKRLRPLLVYATGELFGLSFSQLDDLACAIEFIHTYSLIHDDLPAMDNDKLRRGRPTCHCAFDEATAILAGDALQTLAFQILAESPHLGPNPLVEIIHLLAQASGSKGMAGGQSLDMSAPSSQLEQLQTLHRMKTGALIHASVLMPALAGQASVQNQKELSHYAQCIGLAFQIKDDILDEMGSAQLTGKQPGKDKKNHKTTYTTLMGVEKANNHLHQLVQEALDSLTGFGESAHRLREVAHFIINREY
jgi:geranylgeranyl pyrophosphate synthase